MRSIEVPGIGKVKRCSKCLRGLVVKARTFAKDKRQADGLDHVCAKCRSGAAKARSATKAAAK